MPTLLNPKEYEFCRPQYLAEKQTQSEEAPLPEACTFTPRVNQDRQEHLQRKKSLENLSPN